VRRTLGGVLVGSIDTTASTFARVFSVASDDARLAGQMLARWRSGLDIYGLCLDALRRWPHNPILLREAAADTMLGGVAIKAGARIVVCTQAAMLDPDAFPDPARMQHDRPPGAYLHFGGGLHPCAGRAVNAVQIPALVGTLLDAGAAPAGRIDWAGPFPDRMPVRIDSGAGR
jgi:cytochrome P450